MGERPRLDRPPVTLGGITGALDELWRAVCALAAAAGDLPWTVVGGQMVLLHGLEHGRTPPRVSDDIDAAVDVRAAPGASQRLAAVLGELGYRSSGVSPDGYAHRFARPVGPATAHVDLGADRDEGLVVDLLVPEGLGPRTDTTTVGTGRAFPAPGTSQALARTELVPVVVGSDPPVLVPRPSLLGAIVAKAVASLVDNQDRDRHHQDLVFLCGLVERPAELAAATTRTDRRRLRRAAEAAGADGPPWRADPDARVVLEILAGH